MFKRLPAIILFIFTFAGNAMSDTLFGRENLAAFYAAQVRARDCGEPIRIHIVGDSKVSGVGVSNGYRLDQLLAAATSGYPVSITYEGFGGENSYLWANNEDYDFLTQRADVDLLIVNFGTNEGVVSATGGPQTLTQTKVNHLSAVATLRASRSPSQLSILLLGQPPANNWSQYYNQTTTNMQDVNAILREVADETNSAYFDTLQLFTRAHAEAGWMEQLPTPTYGDGNVHPGNAMNLVLVGELGRALFPLPLSVSSGNGGTTFPALQNGWTAWTSPASTYAPRATLKGGIVFLDGLIKPGVTADYSTLFILPAGYRPAVNRFISVATSNSGGARQIQIMAGGVVRLGEAFAGSYISLDGISFRVD